MTRRIRLHVPAPLTAQQHVEIDGDRARYLGRVLRACAGDAVTLFDGHGGEYSATVEQVTRDRVRLRTLEHLPGERESPLAVRLLQGVSRGTRMDIAIQKATELGVRSVQPVLTARGVVRLDPTRRASRQAHWQAVAVSACEQCGRNRVPEIATPAALSDVLAELAARPPDGTCRLMLDASQGGALPDGEPPAGVMLLIGPEGGLSGSERVLAERAAFAPLRLGPRVLRTETAAIAALAVLQARWGDLG